VTSKKTFSFFLEPRGLGALFGDPATSVAAGASHAPPSDSTVTVTRLARVSRLGTTSSSSPRFWICTTRRFVTEGLSPLRLMTLGTLSLTTARSKELWQMFVAPVQTPPWHESSAVHGSPSWHDVPFVFAGFEQAPV